MSSEEILNKIWENLTIKDKEDALCFALDTHNKELYEHKPFLGRNQTKKQAWERSKVMEKQTDGTVVHYMNTTMQGEHTICGDAFDGYEEEGQLELKPTTKKVNCISCLQSVYDIQQLPKVKVRP